MAEKKKSKKEQSRDEVIAYIEHFRLYGSPYYKKADVLKILRIMVDRYWR